MDTLKKLKFSTPVFILLLIGWPQKSFGNMPVPAHIVVVVLENHSYNQLVGSSAAPYINSLINGTNAALLTESYALMHPSQPNYIQLFSGSAQGVTTDGVPTGVPFTTPNLGAALLNASKTFTAYSEDLPSVGFTGATSGHYARKHCPWVNWQGTGLNGIPATSNQPFTAFPTNYNLLPTVSFVIPNLINDMHDGTDPAKITAGDAWLQTHLDGYIQWAKTNNSLLILTFDEDDNASVQHILTLMVGGPVKAGSYNNPIDHYTVLSMIEDMYGLPNSGSAASAPPIDYCWNLCTTLNVSMTPTPSLLCAGASTTLTASGATSYTWLPGNVTGSSITVSPASTTLYSVTGLASGCTKTKSQYVYVSSAAPAKPASISGSTVVCANTNSVSYSVPAVTGETYTWTVPTGITIASGQGTNKITCNFASTWTSGTLSVKANNGCGTSSAKTLVLISVLTPPSSLTGSAFQCANTTATFTCANVSTATGYTWSITGDATLTSTTTSASATFGPSFTAGTISVKSNNVCGTGTARSLALKNSVATPAAISGTIRGLCPAGTATATYTATAVTGAASYVWTLPAGATGSSSTKTITVTFGPTFTSGNIKAAAVSICGITSTARVLAVRSVLATPTTLSGSASGLCNTNGVAYSCTAMTGATGYTWTVPTGTTIASGQGTNAITANFGSLTSGYVTVKANNLCGSSVAKSLTVKGAPATPGTITGSNAVCANQTGVSYSIAAVTNASSYTWTVPSGASITSGQTTNAVVVNYGTSSGNVSVKANNACGTGSTKSLAVSVSCLTAPNISDELKTEEPKGLPFSMLVNYEMNNLTTHIYPGNFVTNASEISIFNAIGKNIYSSKIFNATQTISCPVLASGIYIVKFTNGEKVFTQKLIVP